MCPQAGGTGCKYIQGSVAGAGEDACVSGAARGEAGVSGSLLTPAAGAVTQPRHAQAPIPAVGHSPRPGVKRALRTQGKHTQHGMSSRRHTLSRSSHCPSGASWKQDGRGQSLCWHLRGAVCSRTADMGMQSWDAGAGFTGSHSGVAAKAQEAQRRPEVAHSGTVTLGTVSPGQAQSPHCSLPQPPEHTGEGPVFSRWTVGPGCEGPGKALGNLRPHILPYGWAKGSQRRERTTPGTPPRPPSCLQKPRWATGLLGRGSCHSSQEWLSMALRRDPSFPAPRKTFLIILYLPSSPSHSLEMPLGTACHLVPGAAPYLRTWAWAVPSARGALAPLPLAHPSPTPMMPTHPSHPQLRSRLLCLVWAGQLSLVPPAARSWSTSHRGHWFFYGFLDQPETSQGQGWSRSLTRPSTHQPVFRESPPRGQLSWWQAGLLGQGSAPI